MPSTSNYELEWNEIQTNLLLEKNDISQNIEDDSVFLRQQMIETNDEIMLDKTIIQNRGVAVRINPKWYNGTVRYYIDSSFSEIHVNLIQEAMKQIEEKTKIDDKLCIQFQRQLEFSYDYLIIQNGTGCSSTIGKGFGFNRITLEHSSTGSCMEIGIILHELLHTLGFGHEQLRPDRDLYLRIEWENIQKDKIGKFKKYTENLVFDLDTPYDYGSVMHYPLTSFTINGSLTMIPTKNVSVTIGEPTNLTAIDILEIQRYYQCVPFGISTTTPRSSATTYSKRYFFIFMIFFINFEYVT